MTKFQFNENGVCINPQVFHEVKRPNAEFSLRVAQLPDGRWAFGLRGNWQLKIEIGGIASPLSDRGIHFETREQCGAAGMEVLNRQLSRLKLSTERQKRQMDLF